LATVALAIALGAASVAHSFSCARLLRATAATDEATEKARHPTVVVLRDRMLESFHGKTTDLFTSIPGFGMERMMPLYKYIPFEIPDLSTNEVEIDREIAAPELLKDVFAKSLDGFRDPSKPLPAKKGAGNGFDGFAGPPKAGFSGSFGGAVTRGLQLRLLDLVGLINSDGPRVYSGGKAFEVQRMTAEEIKAAQSKDPKGFRYTPPPTRTKKSVDGKGHAPAEPAKLETRPLDVFEIAGVAELSQGKDLFIRNRDNVIRMLGALRASEQCLECHGDNKKGDLLGAFSYTFMDTNGTLTKSLKATK
jgi:hypothetical protein